MKILFGFVAIAIAVATFRAANQRREIKAARAEVARLEASQPAPSAAASARASGPAVTEEDVARLRAETRDIHKMRGLIPQAREKRQALEHMKAENSKLREKIAYFKAHPEAASVEPPFSNKGQSMPAAALETAFWLMYQGDVDSLSRVMPMATADYERMPASEKTNSIAMLRGMAAMIEKFEVLEQKMESEDEAHVTVKMSFREGMGPRPTPADQSRFVLHRTNEVWQVVGER